MDPKSSEHAPNWLTLQQASELLGVHPATLRQWADQGKVRVFRTPGGHRRFAEEDVRALLAHSTPESKPRSSVQILVQSALGRARLEVTGGRLVDQSWYRHFDENSKARHRELGRQLLGLLMHFLNGTNNGDSRRDILDQACQIGRSYGTLAYVQGLSLTEAVRAFLFFRDFLQESIIQGQQIAGDIITVNRQINRYVNEVLLAMVQAYEQGVSWQGLEGREQSTEA